MSQITLASPGIVDFGELPSIRSMSISPDGEHIAFVRENRAGKTLVIYELNNAQSAPIEYRLPDEIKARDTTAFCGSEEDRCWCIHVGFEYWRDWRTSSQRVCIVGASYGGYSALAGGAFTPDRYRCVVSISGVADLPKMLIDTKRRFGARNLVNSYWSKVIGDLKKEPDKLKEISPVYSAKQFLAPLLLIHGKDDTVVPLRQSRFMYKAMRKAGRDVQLVVLDGSDHWLSTSETRLRTLEEIGQFVLKHNPPDPVAMYE